MSRPRSRQPNPQRSKRPSPHKLRQIRARRRRRIARVTAVAAVAAIIALVVVAATRGTSPPPAASTGKQAPDGTFTTANGTTRTVSSLRGQPTLLWFVSTWCSSCQAGTQAMAAQIQTFAREHVRVVEVELADDLGQPGPDIDTFARQLAGPAATNPDWTFGVASSELTTTYDPASDLDIYYLLDSAGHVTYINSSPAATMTQLQHQAGLIR